MQAARHGASVHLHGFDPGCTWEPLDLPRLRGLDRGGGSMCGFFQDYGGLANGPLTRVPFGPPPPCRFGPPDQAQFGPLIESWFGPPGGRSIAVRSQATLLRLQLALRTGKPPEGSWTICEFGVGSAPRRSLSGTLSSSICSTGFETAVDLVSWPASILSPTSSPTAHGFSCVPFGTPPCGSRTSRLALPGVRLRIDVPHQFAVARLHDEDDVPVPLQLPQTLDHAGWAGPKRLGHPAIRASAGGGLRVERVGQ